MLHCDKISISFLAFYCNETSCSLLMLHCDEISFSFLAFYCNKMSFLAFNNKPTSSLVACYCNEISLSLLAFFVMTLALASQHFILQMTSKQCLNSNKCQCKIYLILALFQDFLKGHRILSLPTLKWRETIIWLCLYFRFNIFQPQQDKGVCCFIRF